MFLTLFDTRVYNNSLDVIKTQDKNYIQILYTEVDFFLFQTGVLLKE